MNINAKSLELFSLMPKRQFSKAFSVQKLCGQRLLIFRLWTIFSKYIARLYNFERIYSRCFNLLLACENSLHCFAKFPSLQEDLKYNLA